MMCIHIGFYTHTYMCTHACTYTNIHTPTHIHTHTSTHPHTLPLQLTHTSMIIARVLIKSVVSCISTARESVNGGIIINGRVD